MKTFLTLISIALTSSVCFANISADSEYILNHSSSAAQKVQLGTLINKTSNLLIAKYSFAVQGGSTAAPISLLTDLSKPLSYAVLPNKAIIKNMWVSVLTQPASSGTSTVSLGAVSGVDLLAATDKSVLVAGMLQGIPDGSTTKMIKLSADKTVKASVGTTALTAGKFNVFIEYVIGD